MIWFTFVVVWLFYLCCFLVWVWLIATCLILCIRLLVGLFWLVICCDFLDVWFWFVGYVFLGFFST